MKPRSLTGYDSGLLMDIFRSMMLIREFELKVNRLFLQGKLPGTIHLSHGQEATAVGVCTSLASDDFIAITHRGHGQALAKGVSPNALMAELFGKATGCCGGKGGSLHVGDIQKGALPAIAIVAAAAPIVTGMALAFRQKGTKQVAVCFHGDGAMNEGDWHEALNLAAMLHLPVIFACENNLYAVSTRIDDVTLVPDAVRRAKAYGVPGRRIDGNDPIAVFEAAKEAVCDMRNGGGPFLLECRTYRQGGHKRDDPGTYRPKEEVAYWLARDPIIRFRNKLLRQKIFTNKQLEEVKESVLEELEEARAFAEDSSFPTPEAALEDLYA